MYAHLFRFKCFILLQPLNAELPTDVQFDKSTFCKFEQFSKAEFGILVSNLVLPTDTNAEQPEKEELPIVLQLDKSTEAKELQ